MNTFQFITIPFCLAMAILTALRRRMAASRSQGLFWVFLWLTGAAVIAIPSFVNRLANVLGIGRGADLILYLTALIGIFLARCFYFHQRRLEAILTQLVRRDAIQNAKKAK